MELVDGPSLAEVLAGGPLHAAQAMDIVAQAATGLRVAHAAGLIHRDVKPANLLLAPGSIVKITDFGIAHAVGSAAVTPSGQMMGTPGYHAPEQVAGEPVTPASDLYTLGVVAYECLTGAPPFAGTAVEMAVAHRDRPLPPLPASVPADVRAFVAELTAKDPAGRPGSAAGVALRAGRLRDGLRTGTGEAAGASGAAGAAGASGTSGQPGLWPEIPGDHGRGRAAAPGPPPVGPGAGRDGARRAYRPGAREPDRVHPRLARAQGPAIGAV